MKKKVNKMTNKQKISKKENIFKNNIIEERNIKLEDLAAHCGIFCGACRPYLLNKKRLLKERGYKRGCKGCIAQNKNCAFIKRGCKYLKNKKIHFCFECEEFPCHNLKNLDSKYKDKYDISPIENLKKIQKIGLYEWLIEQKKKYTCTCGGEICLHDAECYDCGQTY